MPDCTSGEFRDVERPRPARRAAALVEAVVATGTPTVVVVVSGRAHALPWIAEHVPALVYAWVPGRAGRRGDRRRAVRRRRRRRAACRSRCRAASGQVPVHHDHRAGGGRSQIFGDYVDAPACAAVLRSASASRTRRSSTTRCDVDEPATTDDADRRRRRACATPATAPAPRSCSSSSATRSRASRGPTASSPASRASTLEPGESRDRALHGRPDAARVLRRGDAPRDRARRPCA